MIEDKNNKEIEELINEALYQGDESKLATIARELLSENQWLKAIKISHEKYIKILEEKER